MANESEAAISRNLGDPRAHLPAHNGRILQASQPKPPRLINADFALPNIRWDVWTALPWDSNFSSAEIDTMFAFSFSCEQ